MAKSLPPPRQPTPSRSDGSFNDPVWHRWFNMVREMLDALSAKLSGAEFTANKDQPNGYAGLGAAYQIHFVNAAGTFTSLLVNTNTAARTYTFPNRTDTVVLQHDNVTFGTVTATGLISTSGDIAAGGMGSISGDLGVGGNLNLTGDANVNGHVAVAGACGFNGKTPQTPVALPANATDLATVITLANALKASAISFGFNS